jgi:hypothetical protein
MIYRQQCLAALTHLSLCGEELLRRSFVGYFSIGSDVSEAINRLGAAFFGAAD